MFALSFREGLAAVAIVAGGIASYFGVQMSTNASMSDIRKDVAVQEVIQQDIIGDVANLAEDVSTIDDKLDALLIRQGINPANYEN